MMWYDMMRYCMIRMSKKKSCSKVMGSRSSIGRMAVQCSAGQCVRSLFYNLEVIALLQGVRSLKGLQVVSAPFSQPVTARCSLQHKVERMVGRS
jgi:hypothetical protein